ncbi:conserved hypothetical protein [Gammaproteobacteria bacterium]
MPYSNVEKQKEYLKRYYKKHIEKFKAYKEKNKEKNKEYGRQYQKERKKDEEYRKKQNVRILAWYHANFEKNKEKKNARNRAWRASNKDIINFHTSKRYTAKKQRLPIWLTEENLKQIQVMYTLATSLNKSTGVQWHVDHIIPLQGKNVSGLHVPENLQVIQGSLNSKKGNRFEDE